MAAIQLFFMPTADLIFPSNRDSALREFLYSKTELCMHLLVCAAEVSTAKNGTKQEDAEYHNVVVFGRQAETCAQYLKKGASVLVEGRMQTRTWDAQDGTKKSRTEIVADRVQFGPRGGSAPMGTEGKSTHAAPAAEEIETIEYPDEDINPDDIPF